MTEATLIAGLLSGAVIAAFITATVNTWIARKKALEEDRARVRTVYAEAMEAVAAYRELPYVIRRRRPDDEPGERHRISEEARAIQVRLSYYRAWIRAESPEVGDAYQRLLDQLRAVAGAAAREAWAELPAQGDAEMNIPRSVIDLSPIDEAEEHYIAVAAWDLQHRRTWRAVVPLLRPQPPPPTGKRSSLAANSSPAQKDAG